jgi:hypothetical protein
MKGPVQAALRLSDRYIIELDGSIVKTGNIKNGQLFRQELTEDGILLKRVEDSENEDVGATVGNSTPTPARYAEGAT